MVIPGKNFITFMGKGKRKRSNQENDGDVLAGRGGNW